MHATRITGVPAEFRLGKDGDGRSRVPAFGLAEATPFSPKEVDFLKQLKCFRNVGVESFVSVPRAVDSVCASCRL
jgi:hypothetical protein